MTLPCSVPVSQILLSLLILSAAATAAPAQKRETRVAVSTVVEREVTTGQRAVGTLNPIRVSVIGSAVDGRVIEFLVNRGQFIKQGAPLAKLRTDTLKIELAAATAELDLRKQELQELKEGSLPEEKLQAESRMKAAAASSVFQKSKYERTLALHKRGQAATKADLDQALALSIQAEQALVEATATYDLVKAGPRIEKIKQAEARVNLQNEKNRLIEERIARHTIVAPFDGFVTAEHTEVGAWVSRADLVAEVVRLDEVEVEVNVVGELAVRLKRGLNVRLDVPSFPDELFTGVITQIVPRADIRSRTFPVIIRVKNRIEDEIPRLKAGMLARVELPTGTRRKMPLVPKDALVLGGPKPVVFVVDVDSKSKSKGVVREVSVGLGVADGGLIQVNGPLKRGQYVVVRGNERLRAGQKVTLAAVIPAEKSKTEKKSPAKTASSNSQTETGER
ncbi:MAG: efflux RND transporter periplasmic adaptor subunit [Planctomycetaceae bacterium]|jgi:RND family efflux transporter MFP subunit|nr:efflux RND transporter periplasmic adaptor subunit [Planctomycetaceae bacterium]MBT6483260.1 efflux RND transporter periplasmic adaptor subunit [Planctomycetaceae bacterium]MBT6494587.1 efflux RND transporter periplasmic adaptor subunit [Planctomycetaceae bacterium]